MLWRETNIFWGHKTNTKKDPDGTQDMPVTFSQMRFRELYLASHQETDSQLIPHTEASVPTAPASLHVGQRVVSSLITFTNTLQNKGACEYWGSEGSVSWE